MGVVNRAKRSLSATGIRTSSLHRGALRAWAQVLERGDEGHVAKDEAGASLTIPPSLLARADQVIE